MIVMTSVHEEPFLDVTLISIFEYICQFQADFMWMLGPWYVFQNYYQSTGRGNSNVVARKG